MQGKDRLRCQIEQGKQLLGFVPLRFVPHQREQAKGFLFSKGLASLPEEVGLEDGTCRHC